MAEGPEAFFFFPLPTIQFMFVLYDKGYALHSLHKNSI